VNLLINPLVWLFVLVFSAAGVGTALVPYYVGKRGVKAVLARFPRLEEERLRRVEQLYGDHGSGLLFFSFVPMLGVLLTAGAGIVGVEFSTFVLWVLVGRTLRNSIFLVLIDQGLRLAG
jgi:membrane protein YqaA with SNARE-associated domain